MLKQHAAADQMAQSLGLIRQRFLEGLPERVERLDTLVTRIELRHDANDALSEVAQEMHRFAGVAKTLGFPEIGETARATEAEVMRLRPHALTDADIAQLVGTLDSTVELIAQSLEHSGI